MYKQKKLINRKLTKLLKKKFYFETQSASLFNEKKIINFLNIYKEICKKTRNF